MRRMARSTEKKFAIAAGAVLAAGLGLTGWLAFPGAPPAACPGAPVANTPVGGPFTLVSETGETVTDQEVIDGPVLIYFGYTFCPDVCPFDSSRNAEAADLLAARGHAVKPVFITLDPARDTPGNLAEYTDFMHPEMLGLTGSAGQVDAAAKAYNVYYRHNESDDPDYYFIDHTALTYLAVPGKGVLATFPGAPVAGRDGLTAAALADATACHLDRVGGASIDDSGHDA